FPQCEQLTFWTAAMAVPNWAGYFLSGKICASSGCAGQTSPRASVPGQSLTRTRSDHGRVVCRSEGRKTANELDETVSVQEAMHHWRPAPDLLEAPRFSYYIPPSPCFNPRNPLDKL